MHLFAAKLGALALSPFLLFGGYGHQATHDTPKAEAQARYVPQAALSIKAVDGPKTLGVDESGTWTLDIKARASTTLSYSVKWGDEDTNTSLRSAPSDSVQTSATFSHSYAVAGTYRPTFTVKDSSGRTASKTVKVTVGEDQTLHLDSITPTSGAVGSTITLSGTGFGDDSTVTIGGKLATTTTNDDGTIAATVPTLTAGTYNVRVWDGGERSNAASFTVTAATSSRISISGIDAPTTLTAGEGGTWTVHAASRGSGLRYSVVWGDEDGGVMRTLSSEGTVQSSSTFTHTYDSPGTYKPTFTVTNDEGRSESVSATVVVTQ